MKFDPNRLKGERVARGFTQEKMGKEMGWTRATYAKRENGTVPVGADELAKMAQIMGIDSDKMYVFFV